jgi:DNA-binding GntR family transcriptional regulator
MGKSRADSAYETVRDWILGGEYPPGTPLTRRPIANRLGMSLIPVTEALQRLEADGLIESLPRIGTRVRIPTPGQIRGHYDLRQALETQSARLFAERATPRERERLLRMARHVDDLYSRLDRNKPRFEAKLFQAHQEHARLHLAIAAATRSGPLIEALERSHVLIFNWLYNTAANIETHPPDWHAKLAEVLVEGDPEKADRAMRYHTRYGMDDVIERISVYSSRNGSGGSYRGPQRRTLAKRSAPSTDGT